MQPKIFTSISLASCLALVISITRVDATAIFSSRATFDTVIGNSITDTYSEANYGPGLQMFNDAEMDAVFGQTRYTPTANPNINIVDALDGFSHSYCAGCNGSFILDFTHTQQSAPRKVYLELGLIILLFSLKQRLHLLPSATAQHSMSA
jgi:hypothetical protein